MLTALVSQLVTAQVDTFNSSSNSHGLGSEFLGEINSKWKPKDMFH